MAGSGRRTKYATEINGEVFPNADVLRDRCRSILDKYITEGCPPDVSLNDDDATFFISLVRLRDPSRIPAGDYIADVCRTTREGQVGRHLAFFYGSGTKDMIGWSKLCAGKRKKPQEASDAMRQAIWPQMARAYTKAFDRPWTSIDGTIDLSWSETIVCPKSGRTISHAGEPPNDLARVHHDGVSFCELRDIWLEMNGYTLDTLPIVDREEGGSTVAPGDASDSWQAFHAMNANLVVVSKKWHDEHHANERKGTLKCHRHVV